MNSRFVLPLAAVLAGSLLAGCAAPLIVGGAALGAAVMVQDRRTSGAQIDDETIELRAVTRLTEAFGERAHINTTSYNRQVLLTGEVPSEAARQQAEQIVGRIDNVKTVVNELAVQGTTTLPQRSADVLITGKVRASLVDDRDLQSNAFKVVTERGTVYLMGRVTPREAERATNIARQINGVNRVVRVFEFLGPDQAAGAAPVAPQPAPVSTATPVAPAAAPVPATSSAPAPAAVTTSPVR